MTARGAEGGEKGDPSAGVTRWEEGGVGSGAGAAGGAGGAAPTPVSARRGACAAGRWWRAARSSPSACNRRRAARRSDPAGLVDFFLCLLRAHYAFPFLKNRKWAFSKLRTVFRELGGVPSARVLAIRTLWLNLQ